MCTHTCTICGAKAPIDKPIRHYANCSQYTFIHPDKIRNQDDCNCEAWCICECGCGSSKWDGTECHCYDD